MHQGRDCKTRYISLDNTSSFCVEKLSTFLSNQMLNMIYILFRERHDIAEILIMLALNTNQLIKLFKDIDNKCCHFNFQIYHQ